MQPLNGVAVPLLGTDVGSAIRARINHLLEVAAKLVPVSDVGAARASLEHSFASILYSRDELIKASSISLENANSATSVSGLQRVADDVTLAPVRLVYSSPVAPKKDDALCRCRRIKRQPKLLDNLIESRTAQRIRVRYLRHRVLLLA